MAVGERLRKTVCFVQSVNIDDFYLEVV